MTHKLTIVVPSPDALVRLAARLAAEFVAPRSSTALESGLVLDLRGHLGSGKTVFVRGLARALGVPRSQPILSPTYTLHRVYRLPGGDTLRTLHHLDAYRAAGPADFEGIGFEELCGSGRLTAVEWGNRVEEALPMDRLIVELETVAPEDSRAAVPHADSSSPLPAEPTILPRRVGLRGTGPCAQSLLKSFHARAPELEETTRP